MQSLGTNVFYFHMKMDRVYKDYVFITEDMSKLLKSYKALGIPHILRSRPIGGEGFMKILW